MPGREVLLQPITITRLAYRGLRRRLRRVGFLRSGLYLGFVLRDFIGDHWRRPTSFKCEFEQRDPWGYTRPCEQERFRLATEMLDNVRGSTLFPQALEVGCAEGTFTELLKVRCETLLAVDYVAIALQRARERFSEDSNVRFKQWDLRRDSLQSTYDLIVTMDVLSYFLRPHELRLACGKLVDGVRPGGYLLLCDVRQSEVFETAWWGKSFLRGGKWINATMAEHSALLVVATTTTNTHVLTLFRKAI